MATKPRRLPEPAPDLAPLAPEQELPPGEVVERTEAELDESLEETFPASDPPSWNATARVGKPPRRRPA
jgi:hypothetical protein